MHTKTLTHNTSSNNQWASCPKNKKSAQQLALSASSGHQHGISHHCSTAPSAAIRQVIHPKQRRQHPENELHQLLHTGHKASSKADLVGATLRTKSTHPTKQRTMSEQWIHLSHPLFNHKYEKRINHQQEKAAVKAAVQNPYSQSKMRCQSPLSAEEGCWSCCGPSIVVKEAGTVCCLVSIILIWSVLEQLIVRCYKLGSYLAGVLMLPEGIKESLMQFQLIGSGPFGCPDGCWLCGAAENCPACGPA
ncbi:hypothetical protein Nepgr_005343 [Nepenthes gracilis]|uniref:Uncharacterized protein n=1 Tax=Nepenthes gracilis TaxID=150966 RepID=A0AAD3S3H4_NEPGR|nr:hypothetical protein Nepgr_005343 [Nepenthes gracilis]